MPQNVEAAGLPVSTDTGKAASGAATAPGANGVIATLTPNATVGQWYDIQVWTSYVGSTADAVDNMNLRIGGTALVTLFTPPVVNGQAVVQTFRRIRVEANVAITVNAIAAGGVSTGYRAWITTIPVN